MTMSKQEIFESVRAAFYRGRWVMMTASDGRPTEITLDLKERDDDAFEDINRPFFDFADCDTLVVPADDHGPSVPAQGETTWQVQRRPSDGPTNTVEEAVRVYEFALQDVCRTEREEETGVWPPLDEIRDIDAPDQEAVAAADYVHVYDRVTRERRTLKRPAADAVLTGLRDVAADLRKPRGRYVGEAITVTDFRGIVGPGRVTEVNDAGTFFVVPDFAYSLNDGQIREAGAGPYGDKGWCFYADQTADFGLTLEFVPFMAQRGAPVQPPFGCAALPPVGPLTSTEGLKPGDVLFHADPDFGPVRFRNAMSRSVDVEAIRVPGRGLAADYSEFAFVGRPDADGWMTWAGGENPVPGARVDVRFPDMGVGTARSQDFRWDHKHTPADGGDIVAFRIVDTPPPV